MTAQRKLGEAINNSPRMVAQHDKLQSLSGGAAQLKGAEDELLQGKFKTVQRVEEEEPLQGKFEAVQRVEEEEPLQGKFETMQRVEEEEPLQGKFETLQRVEEEEPLQGKFEAVQRGNFPRMLPCNVKNLPPNLTTQVCLTPSSPASKIFPACPWIM